MKKYLLLIFLVLLLVSISCDKETGDDFPYPITFDGYLSNAPDIFISLIHNGHNTYPKIIQHSLGSGGFSFASFDRLNLNSDDQYDLFDTFTIKLYSSEITNSTNWNQYNQQYLQPTNFEHLVYYVTNISNGLSAPDLFSAGNTLPFYLSTNSRLKITIKEFQTNI